MSAGSFERIIKKCDEINQLVAGLRSYNRHTVILIVFIYWVLLPVVLLGAVIFSVTH